ncbi:hypothetical protein ACFYO0_41550 [Streptomyces sp. NPDC006365]|uniref:hypothetical protein n=1 Tax=Streptomyces sp. NPDC006365 TaxID=3364744 RepID=UPI00369B00FB
MIFLRLGLALSGWVAVAATALPSGVFPRVLVVPAFLLVCPGLAALRWVRPTGVVRDPARLAALESCVLAVVLSLAASVLVAEALFLGDVFTLVRALLILAVLTSVLALVPRAGISGRAGRRSEKSRPEAAGSPE